MHTIRRRRRRRQLANGRQQAGGSQDNYLFGGDPRHCRCQLRTGGAVGPGSESARDRRIGSSIICVHCARLSSTPIRAQYGIAVVLGPTNELAHLGGSRARPPSKTCEKHTHTQTHTLEVKLCFNLVLVPINVGLCGCVCVCYRASSMSGARNGSQIRHYRSLLSFASAITSGGLRERANDWCLPGDKPRRRSVSHWTRLDHCAQGGPPVLLLLAVGR